MLNNKKTTKLLILNWVIYFQRNRTLTVLETT
jgi:hypothetical protein